MQMDWNALSNDPKEVYVLNKPDVLIPNAGKVVSIVVIPNMIGLQQRNLTVRVCPQVMGITFEEDPNLRRVVSSKPMISHIPIEYNCAVPEIIWDNTIEIEKAVYIGETYQFDMTFDNHDYIGGFFFYDVLVYCCFLISLICIHHLYIYNLCVCVCVFCSPIPIKVSCG